MTIPLCTTVLTEAVNYRKSVAVKAPKLCTFCDGCDDGNKVQRNNVSITGLNTPTLVECVLLNHCISVQKYIKKIQQILFASYPSICCCKLTNKAECSKSRYKDTNAIQWNSSNYTCCIETTGRQSNTYKTNIQV